MIRSSLQSALVRYTFALLLGYSWHLAFDTCARTPDPTQEGSPTPIPSESAFRQAVNAVQKTAHLHPNPSPDYFSALEKGFRNLQPRFPKEPEIYAELLFVADHQDGPESVTLVREILDWPATSDVKQKARGVLFKKSHLGRPLNCEFTSIDGPRIRLADLAGKVVLLDFWASWCPPCRESLPTMREIYARFHTRGLDIVGVSFDMDLHKLRRFISQESMPWPQVADGLGWNDSPLAREFGITSLPALWLIDRQGRLIDLHAREDLAQKMERLLSE